MEIEEIYTKISILKEILEWNLQIANAMWCQRECWHHLLHVTHIATLQAGDC